MNYRQEILDGVEIGFIDSNADKPNGLKPSLVYNNINKGINVLSIIKKELSSCREFWFSVAFITQGGIQILKNTLKELENRGVKGKVLTSTYLMFNSPDAFKELLKFSNIEVRVIDENMHTKGYMFNKGDNLKVFIVGSSNITQNALKDNLEWNIKINSMTSGEIINEIEDEFNIVWDRANILDIDWIEGYKKIFSDKKKIYRNDKIVDFQGYKLEPNRMQASALNALDNLRQKGKKKALLISATGTGKTYLSAFDVRSFKAGKVLFIAHREQILKQSKRSYERVLSKNKKMIILSGKTKNKESSLNCDIVFATIQTLSKDENLEMFSKKHFDYIVVDETHRAGADSYKKVIEYFKPKFLLGMTATPERSDNMDIYGLFDYNIAYEIRLKDAMQNKMLCPFCYFGISDYEIIDDDVKKEFEEKNPKENIIFKYLLSDERIRHIDEKMKFYGYSGDRVRGLIFVSRLNEGKELSIKLNKKGYRTVFLSGKDSDDYREKCILRLEQENDDENALDYIITVDIFNEGVDIPSINQIVMLRPTQSSIIFTQQLGRGLRKFEDKEYVTVIDFIGNYKNNYMIPIALSGDRSLKKYKLREFISNVDLANIGLCNIEFDKVTTARIYKSIDSSSLNLKSIMDEKYNELKAKLGRIPNIYDFDKFGSIDPLKLFEPTSNLKYEKKKVKSYYEAIKSLDNEYNIEFSDSKRLFLELICQKMINGKRVHELVFLKNLIASDKKVLKRTNDELNNKYGIYLNKAVIKSMFTVLEGKFEKVKNDLDRMSNASFFKIEKSIEKSDFQLVADDESEYFSDEIRKSEQFAKDLSDNIFKNHLLDMIDYGIKKYEDEFINRYKDTDLCLNRTYTYEDVCRLLRWEKNIIPQNIGGYFYDEDTNTMPVFINYDKGDDIEDSIKYEDKFIDRRTLKAISKKNRSAKSEEIKRIYNYKNNKMKMYLFIRKNSFDKESKEFYFLGEIYPTGSPRETKMPNTNASVVNIIYKLETPVKDELYNYFVNS